MGGGGNQSLIFHTRGEVRLKRENLQLICHTTKHRKGAMWTLHDRMIGRHTFKQFVLFVIRCNTFKISNRKICLFPAHRMENKIQLNLHYIIKFSHYHLNLNN